MSLFVVLGLGEDGEGTAESCRGCQLRPAEEHLALADLKLGPWQDKTKSTPVPASQADEVSDLILIRSRTSWPEMPCICWQCALLTSAGVDKQGLDPPLSHKAEFLQRGGHKDAPALDMIPARSLRPCSRPQGMSRWDAPTTPIARCLMH